MVLFDLTEILNQEGALLTVRATPLPLKLLVKLSSLSKVDDFHTPLTLKDTNDLFCLIHTSDFKFEREEKDTLNVNYDFQLIRLKDLTSEVMSNMFHIRKDAFPIRNYIDWVKTRIIKHKSTLIRKQTLLDLYSESWNIFRRASTHFIDVILPNANTPGIVEKLKIIPRYNEIIRGKSDMPDSRQRMLNSVSHLFMDLYSSYMNMLFSTLNGEIEKLVESFKHHIEPILLAAICAAMIFNDDVTLSALTQLLLNPEKIGTDKRLSFSNLSCYALAITTPILNYSVNDTDMGRIMYLSGRSETMVVLRKNSSGLTDSSYHHQRSVSINDEYSLVYYEKMSVGDGVWETIVKDDMCNSPIVVTKVVAGRAALKICFRRKMKIIFPLLIDVISNLNSVDFISKMSVLLIFEKSLQFCTYENEISSLTGFYDPLFELMKLFLNYVDESPFEDDDKLKIISSNKIIRFINHYLCLNSGIITARSFEDPGFVRSFMVYLHNLA